MWLFHVVVLWTVVNSDKEMNKEFYYSFKLFSRFCLVKTTRIIHHNQLLFTKFGKNLRHIESMTSKVEPTENCWTNDVKMTSKVQPGRKTVLQDLIPSLPRAPLLLTNVSTKKQRKRIANNDAYILRKTVSNFRLQSFASLCFSSKKSLYVFILFAIFTPFPPHLD